MFLSLALCNGLLCSYMHANAKSEKKGVMKVHKYKIHIVCVVIFVVAVVQFTFYAHNKQFKSLL